MAFAPANSLTGIPGKTIKQAVGAASTASVILRGGVKYRVVTDADIQLQIDRPATAAAATDMVLFAKVELGYPLVFGNAGTDVAVNLFSTPGGNIYFTPLFDGTGTNT